MRRFPHSGFKKRSAETNPYVRKKGKPLMARRQSEIDFSPECMEAFDRLVTLAHQLSSVLTGDELSPDTGKTDTQRSAALAMGMLTFLLRTDPGDLKALFFQENSLNQIPFTPTPPQPMREPPLAALLS